MLCRLAESVASVGRRCRSGPARPGLFSLISNFSSSRFGRDASVLGLEAFCSHDVTDLEKKIHESVHMLQSLGRPGECEEKNLRELEQAAAISKISNSVLELNKSDLAVVKKAGAHGPDSLLEHKHLFAGLGQGLQQIQQHFATDGPELQTATNLVAPALEMIATLAETLMQ